MKSSIVAAAAVMVASTSAQSIGSAIVKNACSYPVYLQNTPAAGGGYSAISQTLAPNAQYAQQYTQLSNTDGWSLKLSKSASSLENIMQYEYTFHNDGTIWYDLSDVNGNPWDGNWEITSSQSDCNPVHQAYRFSTDDAYGMQACPQAATLTVTLCSGDASNAAAASSASVSVAAASASAASAGTLLGAPTTVCAPSVVGEKEMLAAPTTSATTFATAVITAAPQPNVNVVVVTEVLTTTIWEAAKAKRGIHRHQHHERHAHGTV